VSCNTAIAAEGAVCAVGGSPFKPASFEKVDNLTIRYTFDEATPAFLDAWVHTPIGRNFGNMPSGRGAFVPLHYLKQFHADFNDKAALDKLVKDEGVEDWVALFLAKSTTQRNTELPVIAPWRVTAPNTGQSWEWERNPYWFVVDTDGNQLPYIDRIVMTLTQDTEVLNLKAMAGEIDYQQRHILLDKFPLYKDNEERGNFKVRLNPNWRGDGIIFGQNWDLNDPVIGKLLQTPEFRQSLALATGRQAFIDAFWLGLGTARNGSPFPTHPWYLGEEYDNKWNYLDLDTANKMLDDLGLTAKDSDGFRLRPDGDGAINLELVYVTAYFQNFEGMADLLRNQWAKVGIKVTPVGKDVSLYADHRRTNQNMMLIGGMAGGRQPNDPTATNADFSPVFGEWYATEGKSGVKPTGDMLRLAEIANLTRPMAWADREELYKEGFKIIIDNQYRITLQHGAPGFMGTLVIKNNVRNTQANVGDILHIPKAQRPDQFFFEGGKNDGG
jgi:peptide/nickel transport system substrate-binding protein